MEGSQAPPLKKHKSHEQTRVPGIIFTFGQPSKLRQASQSLLAALDSVPIEGEEHTASEDPLTGSTVSDMVEKELKALSTSTKRYRFHSELSRGCGLIECRRGVVPSDLVYSLLKHHCPRVPIALVSRVDPVDVVCASNLVSFTTVCIPAIAAKFMSLDKDTTWKVVYDKHCETNLSKEKVIELAHSAISDNHEISIHEPEIVILVHVFQTVCGVGFLREYDQLDQYNIRKLVNNNIRSSTD